MNPRRRTLTIQRAIWIRAWPAKLFQPACLYLTENNGVYAHHNIFGFKSSSYILVVYRATVVPSKGLTAGNLIDACYMYVVNGKNLTKIDLKRDMGRLEFDDTF